MPTWNYDVVHIHGTIVIRDDGDFTRAQVDDLTGGRESAVSDPASPDSWQVDDAPVEFVLRQLRAIVGVQPPVSGIEAKRKMSQNRSVGDREGAADGLARVGGTELADAVRSSLDAEPMPEAGRK